MAYVLIQNGIVVQKQPNEQDWFIAAPDWVICGFLYDGQDFTAPPVPEPMEIIPDISDRQFFQQLAIEGLITEDEALDAVGPGIIPAAMNTLINLLPTEQQFAAKMLIRGATRFERNHPVAELIRNLYGWTPEETNTFWKNAALL